MEFPSVAFICEIVEEGGEGRPGGKHSGFGTVFIPFPENQVELGVAGVSRFQAHVKTALHNESFYLIP